MDAEHFLPFRKSTVVALCAGELPADERESFLEFARLLAAMAQHRIHVRGERVLDAYEIVDPAEDVRTVRTATARDRADARAVVERELVALAAEADFIRIEADEIEQAFAEHDLMKVRLEVEDESIDTVMFFRRGTRPCTEEVKSFYGLRRRTVEFTSYAKVLVYIAFTERPDATEREPSGGVLLKMFQDVPRNDLEMLYPTVRVRMRTKDKVLIGVPAVLSGLVVLATKLLASLGLMVLLLAFWVGIREETVRLDQAALVTLFAGLAALGSYLWRQFSKFKNRKIKMLKTLQEHLYFRNLGNGAGVFHHLLDAAAESEVKETLLTYHFLRTAEQPLTAAGLDRVVEQWFGRHWDTTFDFDVRGGLRTLRQLDLLTEDEQGVLGAIALPEAKHRLDRHWDNLFHMPVPGAAGVPTVSR
ncbi:TMEM143 family protein [Nocardia sp. NPDC057668]|uniref:TMEM143 family protein n=1 Tax=Nocardia sp. NPDC057668 TaxID=3346202 RepID=UPI00366A9C56